MKCLLQKKAQAETSINWVFVLIAGGIILLFFGILIFRYQSTNEKEGQAIVVNNFNSLLSGLELSSRTYSLVQDFPQEIAYFNCQGYSIGDLTGSFQRKIVFAPSKIQLNPLLVWAYDFNLPFYVNNFMYLINPSTRYVFVYGQSFSESVALKNKLSEELPTIMNKIFVQDLSSVNLGFNDKIVFLKRDGVDTIISSFKGVVLDVKDNNELTFYYNSEQKGDSIYLNDASLFGAIIVDDVSYYDCMIDQSLQRTEKVAYVLNNRKIWLSVQPSMSFCSTQFGDSISEYSNYLSAHNFESIKYDNNDFDENNFMSLVNQLDAVNEQLQILSCPNLY